MPPGSSTPLSTHLTPRLQFATPLPTPGPSLTLEEEIPPHDTDPSSAKRRRNKEIRARMRLFKSCTRCRQHKTKCDALQRIPLPCSGCEKKQIPCEFSERAPPQRSNELKTIKTEVLILQLRCRQVEAHNRVLERMLQRGLREPSLEGLADLPPQLVNRDWLLPGSLQPTPPASDGALHGSIHGSRRWAIKEEFDIPPAIPAVGASSVDATFVIDESPIAMPTPMPQRGCRSSACPSTTSPHSVPNSDNFPPSAASRATLELVGGGRSPFTDTGLSLASSMGAVPALVVAAMPEPAPTVSEYPVYDSYRLGSVQLQHAEVEALFNLFHKEFYPFFPIFNPQKTFYQIHTESALLFWTLILIASTNDPDPGTLYEPLAALVKQCVVESCWYSTPRSSFTIQALLLLTTWSLPSHKLLDDVSYRFLGLSRNIGMQLGLHRGAFITEFSRGIKGKDVAYRSKLWRACFINEVYYSSILGLPCGGAHWDQIIDKGVAPTGTVDFEFYFNALVEVSKLSCKITETLGNSITTSGLVDAHARFLHVSCFSTVVEDLIKRLLPTTSASHYLDPTTSVWAKHVYLQVASVRLQLLTFTFFPNSTKQDQRHFIKKAVHECLDTANVILHLVGLSPKPIGTYPIHFRSLLNLVCFILTRVQMFPLLSPELLELVLGTLRDLYDVLAHTNHPRYRRWSQVDSDSTRTMRILKNFELALWINPMFIVSRPFMISHMRSHRNASLTYEVIWFIHKIRKLQGSVQPSGALSSVPASPVSLAPELEYPIADGRIETSPIANEHESLLLQFGNDPNRFFLEYCELDPQLPAHRRLMAHFTNPPPLFGDSPPTEAYGEGVPPLSKPVAPDLEAILEGVQWVTEKDDWVLDGLGLSEELG